MVTNPVQYGQVIGGSLSDLAGKKRSAELQTMQMQSQQANANRTATNEATRIQIEQARLNEQITQNDQEMQFQQIKQDQDELDHYFTVAEHIRPDEADSFMKSFPSKFSMHKDALQAVINSNPPPDGDDTAKMYYEAWQKGMADGNEQAAAMAGEAYFGKTGQTWENSPAAKFTVKAAQNAKEQKRYVSTQGYRQPDEKPDKTTDFLTVQGNVIPATQAQKELDKYLGLTLTDAPTIERKSALQAALNDYYRQQSENQQGGKPAKGGSKKVFTEDDLTDADWTQIEADVDATLGGTPRDKVPSATISSRKQAFIDAVVARLNAAK